MINEVIFLDGPPKHKTYIHTVGSGNLRLRRALFQHPFPIPTPPACFLLSLVEGPHGRLLSPEGGVTVGLGQQSLAGFTCNPLLAKQPVTIPRPLHHIHRDEAAQRSQGAKTHKD